MKRTQKFSRLFAMLFVLGFSQAAFSQTLKNFFSDNSVSLTYLGIDYSNNRLINDPGANARDIEERLYTSMNNVVVDEMKGKNYNITGAFDRSNMITVDISAVEERNDKIKASDILSSSEADFNRLSESDIAKTVKALDLKGKSGIGLVFVMEGMKKEEKKSYGAVWVTLIDMKTKKVLMTERMEQEAAGFGFRNFWVSIIKKTIIEIDKKKYKSWKSAYGS